MNSSSKLSRAFTLIEMLTVIAIIGLLAALLFPAINGALAKSKVNKAQVAITSGLAVAFRSYYTEYGKWPIADTVGDVTYIVDANMVQLLQGKDVPNTTPAAKYPSGTSGTFQGNPRGIHFLDFKAADLDASGRFVDPWKQPYYCRFDVTYANLIQDPFMAVSPCPGPNCINAGFLVWSSGPNGQFDNTGDVPPSALNKDNVKSW